MEENNGNVEIFEDDSVIELFDENEQAVQFREIASIELDGKFYQLLQPVEPLDGIGEDEAVIFRIDPGEDGEEIFAYIEDDAEWEMVVDTYNDMLFDEDE